MKNTTQSKRRVALVTQSRFWKEGAGLWARTRETINFLSMHTELTVVVLTPLLPSDIECLRSLGLSVKVVSLSKSRTVSPQLLIQRFIQTFESAAPFDAYFVDKTENSFMLSAFPSGSRTIVDTHDLISARTISTRQHGVPENFPLTEKQEAQLLARYDIIACIQKDEYEKVCEWVNPNKVILAPHTLKSVRRPTKDTVRRIGLVANLWHANIDGITDFIANVWPRVLQPNLSFDIYGHAAKRFVDFGDRGIVAHGFVQDLAQCYDSIDIAINPVRYGAGLKIKTIEAMAHGVPIVTSIEGASGLGELDGSALLVARDADHFVSSLNRLIEDRELRSRLAETGSQYVETRLTPELCYGGLLDAINC